MKLESLVHYLLNNALHDVFALLGNQPIIFLLLVLSLGYPLGRVSFARISLGSTAGTLLVGVIISLSAKVFFGITYDIPSILSSIFLLLFMYALGLSVGPQFFAGLRSGGFALITTSIIVWGLNWLINVFGARFVGLAPGYSSGLIAGSYTITAVMGAAQSAIQSTASHAGLSADQIGANMAAGYAISYILSSIGIIVLIRYLPQAFGHDPVKDAQIAEEAFSGGSKHAVPGSPNSLILGFSPYDLRAYRVENTAIVGKTPAELFKMKPQIAVLRIVRNDQVIDFDSNPIIKKDDILTVRNKIHELLTEENKLIGPEVDNELARNIPIEMGDVRVTARSIVGKTLGEIGKSIGFGVHLVAVFRDGHEIPVGPKMVVAFGDVVRVSGPKEAIKELANTIGGKPILRSTTTEVTYLALGMLIGYLAGIISVRIASIPFSLGTSTGCMLAGIFVSYFRSKNPEFSGPVDEGARSFLQDIGLNLFVAVLAANVGPKLLTSFQGTTVIWLALIGTTSALLPVVIAYVIDLKVFKMNSVIADGAVTGARNATPGLSAIMESSKSSIAAVPFPLTYALSTVLALIGGYIAMLIA